MPVSGFLLSPSEPHPRMVCLAFFLMTFKMSSALNCRECGVDLIKVPDDESLGSKVDGQ